MKKNVDDYLKEGIYGAKELNPAEKKMFLGTFKERVYKALTISQVMRPSVYQELLTEINAHKNGTLLLNGSISYPFLSPYIKQATTLGVPFSIVQNLTSDTKIGLVYAAATAVDREDIFIEDDRFDL